MTKQFLLFFTCLFFSLFSQNLPQETDQRTSQEKIYHSQDLSSSPDFQKDPTDRPVEGRDFMWEFVNMLITLGFVIVLLFALMWFLRRIVNNRMNQMNTSSHVKILETRALSSKTVIYLLEIQGTGIAIAESHNGITRLSQFDLNIFNHEEAGSRELPS